MGIAVSVSAVLDTPKINAVAQKLMATSLRYQSFVIARKINLGH